MSLSRRADGLGCKPTLLGRLSVIFNDLRNSPPEPFMDCIASVEKQGTIPGVKEAADRILHMAKDAVEFGHLKECGLSVDDVAMIMQYSAEDTVPPFYKELNRVCYDRDRSNAHAYAKSMWLLAHALKKLPRYGKSQVFRGVKLDLSADYPEGRTVVWHGWVSTTTAIKVLETPQFCGDSGDRTFFIINLTQSQGRDITTFSLIPGEAEVLLPPGTTIKVVSVMSAGSGLTIIQLEELPSRDLILDLRDAETAVDGAGCAEADKEESQVIADTECDFELPECDFEVHAGTANFCGRYRENGSLRGFPSYEKVDDKERFIPRGDPRYANISKSSWHRGWDADDCEEKTFYIHKTTAKPGIPPVRGWKSHRDRGAKPVLSLRPCSDTSAPKKQKIA